MPIVGFYTNFLENFPREWKKVELHEERLLITFEDDKLESLL